MRHYEKLKAMRRNLLIDEESAFLNLSAEEQRKIAERALQPEQDKVDWAMSKEDMATWIELHREYVDCDANSEEMKSALYHRGKLKAPTLRDLEDAYDSCRAAGVLQLNQAVLQQQEKKKHQKRAGEIEARGGVAAVAANTPTESEEELETMPLEEIRRRATTGGWYR
jgi:hypothetical protein